MSEKQMKLTICNKGTFGQYILCDQEGTPLPLQLEASLDQTQNDIPRFVVAFYVDGDRIRFADKDGLKKASFDIDARAEQFKKELNAQAEQAEHMIDIKVHADAFDMGLMPKWASLDLFKSYIGGGFTGRA